MDALSWGTTIALIGIMLAYAWHHFSVARSIKNGRFNQITGMGSLTVERDNKITDRAQTLVAISYAASDPLALRFDYTITRNPFDSLPRTYTVLVERNLIAHALGTGASPNLKETAELLAIFCSPSRKRGKGNTTFTWRNPYDAADVHILTVPTKSVLKVLNASYAIVAPGEELNEPSNNLDSVLDEILSNSTSKTNDDD